MTLLAKLQRSQRGQAFGALGAVEGVAIVPGMLIAGLLAGALEIVWCLVAQGAGQLGGGGDVRAGRFARRTGLRRSGWADA